MQLPNKKIGWTDSQIQQWFAQISQTRKRSYQQDVAARLQTLPANLVSLEQYGSLKEDIGGHPLFRVTVGDVNNSNPTILLTSGVHGYEPSGVEASIRFLEKEAPSLTDQFNFVVYPCVSPWSYEFDHRWNNRAEDPNRCFSRAADIAQIDECTHFMNSIETSNLPLAACALDLHETPDRDVELRRKRAERFGIPLAPDFRVIPDGFYLILTQADEEAAQGDRMLFGRAIVDAVRGVSPIATHDRVLGKENLGGIIFSPPTEGMLRTYLGRHAEYAGVTEVYSDHPVMTPERSVEAQLSAIRAATRFVHERYVP